MKAGSHCDCLLCRLEESLIAEFKDKSAWNDPGSIVDLGAVLGSFATPLDLLQSLHTVDARTANSSDPLLIELLRANARAPGESIWQKLLLLAFIPTIHRTTSHIARVFPSLVREDVSQHVVAVFLALLGSPDLEARRSHIAFAIARKLRRIAFRWAIHESHLSLPKEMHPTLSADFDDQEPLDAGGILRRFLDNCQRVGRLSPEERHLLVEVKIDGTSCRELAERNGHSAVAIQHRIQRLVDRLRRLAEKSPPHQFELFPR